MPFITIDGTEFKVQQSGASASEDQKINFDYGSWGRGYSRAEEQKRIWQFQVIPVDYDEAEQFINDLNIFQISTVSGDFIDGSTINAVVEINGVAYQKHHGTKVDYKTLQIIIQEV